MVVDEGEVFPHPLPEDDDLLLLLLPLDAADLPHHHQDEGLLLLLHVGALLPQEDILLQYRGDTLLLHLQREEQLLPLLNEGHHHLHHQSVGSLILHLPNKEAPQSLRDVPPRYHQSIGKGLLQADLPARLVRFVHHNQTNGIRPHHGLELLRPPQVLHLSEEEHHHHPKEDSPHLQVLDPLGESPGLRNLKRQKRLPHQVLSLSEESHPPDQSQDLLNQQLKNPQHLHHLSSLSPPLLTGHQRYQSRRLKAQHQAYHQQGIQTKKEVGRKRRKRKTKSIRRIRSTRSTKNTRRKKPRQLLLQLQ